MEVEVEVVVDMEEAVGMMKDVMQVVVLVRKIKEVDTEVEAVVDMEVEAVVDMEEAMKAVM